MSLVPRYLAVVFDAIEPVCHSVMNGITDEHSDNAPKDHQKNDGAVRQIIHALVLVIMLDRLTRRGVHLREQDILRDLNLGLEGRLGRCLHCPELPL